MADSVSIKLEGLDEVRKAIRKLPEKPARRVMRKALRAGSTVIIKRARQLTPVRTGRLKRSWRRRFSKSFDPNITAEVLNAAPYAHLVEFGTGPRKDGKTGASRGVMPAHPMIRPAVEGQIEAINAAMRKKADESIKKEWEKLTRTKRG